MDDALISSRHVWMKLARTLLVPPDKDLSDARLTLTGLQESGARQAFAVLQRYGGVIVADSVGTGKTYVALRLVVNALDRGRGVVVIVPATLRQKWRAALASAGIEATTERDTGTRGSPQVILTSHALVSRVRMPRYDRQPLIVIDEAHQFRNPRTERYRALAQLTAHARVVMLTATPINNRHADLYWLLRLFLGDGALASAGVPDLRAALLERDAVDDMLVHRAALAIVIRRTRADHLSTDDSGIEGLCFPRQHPPRPIHYEPDAAELALLTTVERTLPHLRLSAFDVPLQHRQPARQSTAMLVRYGLLKRVESSTDAFRASLLRLLRFFDAFADAIACGGYVRAADVRVGDPLQLLLTGLIARPLPRNVNRTMLHDDVRHDRELIRAVLASLPEHGSAKSRALIELLDRLGSCRRVVFTEYAETAEALFAMLPPQGTALLHGTRAALASGTASRRVVLEGFAPIAFGTPLPRAHIRTLIATDVLAEGLDLQNANHCISYDLPWNPVRLMQRAGRIDRLGSPHSDVFVWYFKPRNEVERWLGLMQRLGVKLRTISTAIGAEHGAVGGGVGIMHEPVHSGSKEDRNPNALRMLRDVFAQVASQNERRMDVPLRDETPRAAGAVVSLQSADFRTLLDDPVAARTTRCSAELGADRILFARCVDDGDAWVEAIALSSCGNECGRRILGQLVVERALCRLGELSSAGRWLSVQDAPQMLRTAVEDARGDIMSSGGGTISRQVADAVRSALVRTGGSASPALYERADRILQQLQAGAPVAVATELARVAVRRDQAGAVELLDRLEALLRPADGRGSRPFSQVLLVCTATTRASPG